MSDRGMFVRLCVCEGASDIHGPKHQRDCFMWNPESSDAPLTADESIGPDPEAVSRSPLPGDIEFALRLTSRQGRYLLTLVRHDVRKMDRNREKKPFTPEPGRIDATLMKRDSAMDLLDKLIPIAEFTATNTSGMATIERAEALRRNTNGS